MKHTILQTLKIATLALVLSFGLSYVYAWTAPTATPPSSNVAAPINVSSTAQTKTGDLTISGKTNTSGGLIIETRAADPAAPVTGQMWIIN